ncbi:BatD family protein [Zavarzinella formosa]|uniref:BatD family protein n=1 Tax=Zavarzinella formosa TaxID=360055 RepID=UPI0002DE2CF0|nr:BatD family protein [Zavarzinella formosa]
MRNTLLIVLLIANPAFADPPASSRVELSPKTEAWVGQRVQLIITLFAPDLFAGAPSFDIPPVPGVIVLPPSGSPTIGSETVGGESFTTQRHEFSLYAQRPGVVKIPAIKVRFETNAGFGKPVVVRRVTTSPVSYEAKSPPGAEKLGTVIAARNLQVTESWKPDPADAKAGDAFTRTVTITADDTPGMIFPPMRLGDIDGLAAYPKKPVINDHTNRGQLTGERVETITYVCEKPGHVDIPARRLTWWDADEKKLKSASLPARSLEVASNKKNQSNVETSPVEKTSSSRNLLRSPSSMAILTILCLVVFTGGWLWSRRRATRSPSEKKDFNRLCQTCRVGDAPGAYTSLLAWIDWFNLKTPDELSKLTGDPELSRAIDDLRSRVYIPKPADPLPPWSGRLLDERIRPARLLMRQSGRLAGGHKLPPLNPVG